jgi:hypothetical protein
MSGQSVLKRLVVTTRNAVYITESASCTQEMYIIPCLDIYLVIMRCKVNLSWLGSLVPRALTFKASTLMYMLHVGHLFGTERPSSCYLLLYN